MFIKSDQKAARACPDKKEREEIETLKLQVITYTFICLNNNHSMSHNTRKQSSGVPTRSDISRPLYLQKKARCLKVRI